MARGTRQGPFPKIKQVVLFHSLSLRLYKCFSDKIFFMEFCPICHNGLLSAHRLKFLLLMQAGPEVTKGANNYMILALFIRSYVKVFNGEFWRERYLWGWRAECCLWSGRVM